MSPTDTAAEPDRYDDATSLKDRRLVLLTGHEGNILSSSGIFICTLTVALCGAGGPSGKMRSSPSNTSYELMTCAVGLAVLVSSLAHWRLLPTRPPAAAPSAFLLFATAWPWIMTGINAAIGATDAAVLWALLGAAPSTLRTVAILLNRGDSGGDKLSLSLSGAISFVARDRSRTSLGLRVLLLAFTAGFTIAAVMPPAWDSIVQQYIRWHPYTYPGEALWRGTFASFATCNLLAATDPAGTHVGYTMFMAAQGVLHGTTMLFDNRIEAERGGKNGNIDHIIEVCGFLFLGVTLIALLVIRLRPSDNAQSSTEVAGGNGAPVLLSRGVHEELGLLVRK